MITITLLVIGFFAGHGMWHIFRWFDDRFFHKHFYVQVIPLGENFGMYAIKNKRTHRIVEAGVGSQLFIGDRMGEWHCGEADTGRCPPSWGTPDNVFKQ